MELIQSETLKGGSILRLLRGDLTQSEADAIVNAANERLRHGAGVAGAIVSRGGKVIQAESDNWVNECGPIAHDRAALTTAGDLPCKAVIHVVGPRWGEGDEDRKLSLAVTSALETAQKHQFESIAFPAISTGIFGFPVEQAAEVMLSTVHAFFENLSDSSIRRVDFVLFDQGAASTFRELMQERRS